MSLIEAWLHAIAKELAAHKSKMAVLFALVMFAVVAVGFLWPKTYEAGSLVFADEQNIIKPLLSGSAEVTKPEIDQVGIARDRIMSTKIIVQALTEMSLAKSSDDESKLDPMIRGVRGGIIVTDAGRGHVRIAYRSSDASKAYSFAVALTNAFISDTSRAKKQESGEAYQFISSQVSTYKEQLQAAEQKLKNFKATNSGTGTSASRMEQLRAEEAKLTLDLQIARAQRDELRRQVSSENQFVSRKLKSEGLRETLSKAQAQLDTLRLSYNETYPDIVSLKQQMQDLEKAIADSESAPASAEGQSGGGVNPVYTQMRRDLSGAEVNVRSLELRLDSTRKLLLEEQSYSKQGAEYDAQLAELTRDYTVTKQLYEDMLERKERARLSVALDVEGQGVTYKIKEPPIYPTVPVGLRFVHFFVLAPVLGAIVPFVLLISYIQLDPRIRFVEKLEFALPETVQVLSVIPHMTTLAERRKLRNQWFRVAQFVVLALVIYVSVAVLRLSGVA